MKKLLRVSLVAAISAIMFSQPAYALFVNGGFETGNDTGWTITGDHSVVSSFTPQFNNTAGWNSLIPWYGQHSLLLGSPGVGNEWDNYHSSHATQQDTITQDDIDNGAHLYFKWGALLEEPTNYVHSDSSQPAFSIDISKSTDGGTTWSSLYSRDHRANEGGWTNIGTNASGDAGAIWYNSEIVNVDLAALTINTLLKLDLNVKDCGAGGHGGLVLLDGFGTKEIHDPVPEPATMLLLGTGLAGLIGARRRKKA